MSQQEVGLFCKEIATIVQTRGFAEGFETARQKIHEYPHDETMLHFLTFQLDGLLTLSGLSPDELQLYDDMIITWYRQLAESNDDKISNSANYMIVSRLIRNGDYDRAQEVLDLIPDKEEIMDSMADKLMLQVIIYQHQGKAAKAAKDLQHALLKAVNKVQLLLCKMIDAELASGEIQTAKSIAEKASQMTELFDLWEYHSFLAPLQVAFAEKNTDECICLLQKMLQAMLVPWDMSNSPLYHRMETPSSDPKKMLPAILSKMEEQDPAYDFLQNRTGFQTLISEYKAMIKE